MATKKRKPRPIVNPCPTYPKWSIAKYRAFIRSAMRTAWNKWPPKYEVLLAARRKYQGANKKQKWEYQCCTCHLWVMGKDISVDHIVPWGSLEGLSLDVAWRRLLVPASELQCLCRKCHDKKTQLERISSDG